MIDLEKAKELMKKAIDESDTKSEIYEKFIKNIYSCGYNDGLKNDWIPCSERLPEHSYGMSFLVIVKDDDNYKKVMICEWSSFSKSEDAFSAPKEVKINGFTYWAYQPVPMDRIIAWLELKLPEPYGEGGEK